MNILNRKGYPVAEYIYSLFVPYSNMNHSCPYNVSINRELVAVLIKFFSEWYAAGIKRATVETYGTLT